MKDATKTALVDALEAACDCGYGEVSFRPDYSGRGMYGRNCVGITGSMSDCMAVIAYVISELADEMVDALQTDEPVDGNPKSEFDQCVATLLNFNQDSMGRDCILYWPRLTAVTKDEPETESETY